MKSCMRLINAQTTLWSGDSGNGNGESSLSWTEHIRVGILPLTCVMREEYCLCALRLRLNF